MLPRPPIGPASGPSTRIPRIAIPIVLPLIAHWYEKYANSQITRAVTATTGCLVKSKVRLVTSSIAKVTKRGRDVDRP